MRTTPSQERALDAIRREAHDRLHPNGDGRILRFEIKPLGSRILSVYIVVRPTAEGTFGAIFPYHGHFFVGPRGGIRIAGVGTNPKFKGKRGAARRYPLIYGFYS